jgi:hypothetical protein
MKHFLCSNVKYKNLWVIHCHSSVFQIWHKFNWSFCFFPKCGWLYEEQLYVWQWSTQSQINIQYSHFHLVSMPPMGSFLQLIFSICAKRQKERKKICQPMESSEWKNYPSCNIDKLPLVSHYPSLKFSHSGSMWWSDTWFRLTIVHFVWEFQHERGIMPNKFMAVHGPMVQELIVEY